jgi:diguanylate cyclase (GGDEF)-like protein
LLLERPRLRRLREDTLRLQEDTLKDELTGLKNPRAQKQKLPEEMRAARERQKTLDGENRDFRKDGLCAILLDIDNFKRVNDTVGYASGNFVLQQFAELLDNNRKTTDLVFRFGGDEFLILTPRTPPEGAIIYADKLRGTVASTNFKARDDNRNISLTVCAGVTAMKYPDDDTQDDLLKRANAALSVAKQKKNSVEIS